MVIVRLLARIIEIQHSSSASKLEPSLIEILIKMIIFHLLVRIVEYSIRPELQNQIMYSLESLSNDEFPAADKNH